MPTLRWLLALLPWTLLAAAAADPANYAKPELLIEAAELAKPATAKNIIILDTRTKAKYDAGRIPQARWVDHPTWVKAFANGKDVDGWSKRLGALGITPTSTVVLYDDTGVKDAAQTWWLLRYWGVADVRLLNGGWSAWKAGNLPLETTAPAAVTPTTPTLKPQPQWLATKEHVQAIVKDKKEQLIDARSEGEFTGADKHAKRGGTIPGSTHLDWTELLDAKTQRFKDAGELTRLFKEAGVNVKEPGTAFCQTGRRSSVTVFALELLGNNQVRNYFNSWFEWGNLEDTPVVPGKVK